MDSRNRPRLSQELMKRMTETQPRTVGAVGATRPVEGFRTRRQRDGFMSRRHIGQRHIGQYARSNIGSMQHIRPAVATGYRTDASAGKDSSPSAAPPSPPPGNNRVSSALPPSQQHRNYGGV